MTPPRFILGVFARRPPAVYTPPRSSVTAQAYVQPVAKWRLTICWCEAQHLLPWQRGPIHSARWGNSQGEPYGTVSASPRRGRLYS